MKKSFVVYIALFIIGIIGVCVGFVVPNSVVADKNTYVSATSTSFISGKNYNVDITLKNEIDVDFVRIKFNSNIALVSNDKNYTIDYPYDEIKIDGKKIHIEIVLSEQTEIIKMGLIQKIWVFDSNGNQTELENAEWKVPTIICVAGASGLLSAISLILLVSGIIKSKKVNALIEELSMVFDGIETQKLSLQELSDLKKGLNAKDFEQDYFENKNEMLKIIQKYNLKKKN